MAARDTKRILIPLTIFSMFFGAGNLIFPPFLALESGGSFIPAFIGFSITAIGLPVAALLAVERTNGLEPLSSRVHPAFGRIYTIAIYLAIGPCLAIPRTASASFEMAAKVIGTDSGIASAIYSLLFFTAASVIAMRPEKLTKVLGRITCPLLLILIAVLAAGCFSSGYGTIELPAVAKYSSSPVASGLIDGYQTMDAIAALIFGIVIALNIRDLGYEDAKEARRIETIGGIIAGVLLLAVYLAIAMIGRYAGSNGIFAENGADVLSSAAFHAFGKPGLVILSAVFIAACLNTCIGLLSSCGEYFSMLFPAVGYRTLVVVFAVFSAIVSNIGLNIIISMSVPVLSFLYPVAIILTIYAFLPSGISPWSMRLCIAGALIESALSLAGIGILPLSDAGFGWVIPSFFGALIGAMIMRQKCKYM